MKTNKEYIEEGIEFLKGKANIGDIVGHISDKIAYLFSDKINDNAICTIPDKGITKTFPVDEIFNVNELKSYCVNASLKDKLFSNRNN